MNSVSLSGRLTHEPDLRFTTDGAPTLTFHVAVNHEWTNRNGVLRQETSYVTVVAYGELAERTDETLSKGDAVVVHGRLRTDHSVNPARLVIIAGDIGASTRKATVRIERQPSAPRPSVPHYDVAVQDI